MRTLKNAGNYKVLSKTDDVIFQIANAARTCYKSNDKSSEENDLKLVQNLLTRGHHAMIEFADLTVKFNDVSRGFCHEIVRHRLASFAQESTRYVDESDLNVVVPPHKNEYDKIINLEDGPDGTSLDLWLQTNEKAYRSLLEEGYKPEDARQILPIGTVAPICVKANLRQWRQIFDMRCDKFAHWEIRTVMLNLLEYCQEHIPLIFDDYHFYETLDGKEYARTVESDSVLLDKLKHKLGATPEFIEKIKGMI